MKRKLIKFALAGLLISIPYTAQAGYVDSSTIPPDARVPPGYEQSTDYPSMQIIPGSPVYYATNSGVNLFFYDGVYWSFFNDGWYMSSWYSGPWYPVDPFNVPLYLLNVPVRYYVNRPAYFGAWGLDERPHWDEHFREGWGNRWQEKSREFNQFRPSPSVRPAPLPTYQQRFDANHYPQRIEEQHSLHQNNYNYQPKEPVVQQHFAQPPLNQPVRMPTPATHANTNNQTGHNEHPEGVEHH